MYTKQFEEKGIVIGHEWSVDPPEIFIRKVATQDCLGGIKIASMIALGQEVLEIVVRDIKDNACNDSQN